MKKVVQSMKQKYRTYRLLLKENPRELLKFEIGLLIGFLLMGFLNSLFGIITICTALLLGVLAIVGLFFLNILGLEDSAIRFLSKIEEWNESESSFEFLPFTVNTAASIIEFITELTRSLTYLGRAIFGQLTVVFPVLLDIKIDVDWLHVSLPYISRTFFNIVQFAIIYYIYRKTKRRLRRKIKDKFSKKETDWSAIKCF